MSKFYNTPEREKGIVRNLNEDAWFVRYQKLLLWMANKKSGRDLLCIDKNLPRITAISKKHITARVGENEFVSDFRIGAKWANVIRCRWIEFNEYARYYEPKGWVMSWEMFQPVWRKSVFGVPVLLNTTTTFSPDPNPETTTVDGHVRRNPVAESWTSIRGGVGTGADNNTTASSGNAGMIISSGSGNNYTFMGRGIYLFDTSSIPDGDSISAATLTLFSDDLINAGGITEYVTIVVTNPASNTALVASDYNIANWTMTQQNSTDLQVSSWAAAGSANDFAFNATGIGNISKTGVSKFGVVLKSDRTNTEPTWTSTTDIRPIARFADYAGTSSDPKLVVTHTAATANPAFLLNFM